ncbi:MAG: hypothetical protein GYB68_05240 [Chloroflexi bacterium]|nr:hypothetical protein [Chloroflexota bacterium]
MTFTNDRDHYDAIEIDTLMSVLLDPDAEPDTHQKSLASLARRHFLGRTSSLIKILSSVVKNTDKYDQDVMSHLIDIFATDPDPDATSGMIEMLPKVAESVLDPNTALDPEFREYYYQALATRQREEDLAVWAELLPEFKPKTLIAILIDPTAEPLMIIEPYTLLDRAPEPERTRSLMSLVAALASTGGSRDRLKKALELLIQSHDDQQYEQGLDALSGHWERAKKAKRTNHQSRLEAVLKALDKRPRTPGEMLTGRRPWAG